MKKIGFIGLGIMGAPMAKHLIEAGHSLFVNSRSGVPQSLASYQLTVCDSGKQVAELANIIILMLPDTPDVGAVLFGANGVAEANLSGKVVVDMSSISPIETKKFASRIEQLGGHYLDAPVSGGEVGARAASLSIMVGGPQPVFEQMLPVLQLMGKNITRVGGNGDGQTAKVANQIVVALTIEAVGEALLFASRAGANPEKVRQALLGGFASSKILEVHGERMVKRTFDPGFRITLHQKDLNLALSSAQQMALALPVTALAQQLFNSCVAQGGGSWDHSAMVRALEKLSDYSISAQ
ncbi:2-hydroxy-3-oxopropionate reductase [Aquitalea sp. USM4]|uniref:2-hydroxy-3-oxopropionate reductase n=1 Tax=Aquitalea sp. USM4 TaxID=1590041 RepID=UPI00103B29EB|nr:2-hydroxy-3-oxopropionate reductase [Aquitalea sp. USM4]QBJ78697.1 2-hydroxy-3-oxopropionate reductase [Aquitalea sp. USM4]